MPKGNPTPPLVGGNSARTTILEGYVFQSGIQKPEHSSILTYKYPQYYLNSLMDRLSPDLGIEQETWSWNIMDRTREGSKINSIATALPAATVTLTTDFDYSGDLKGYLIAGDVIRVESGAVLRVSSTDENSSKQRIVVTKVGGGNITSTDIQADDKFGHIGNLFGEASSAPEGRLYLPTEEYNNLQVLRRSFSISGHELTNKTWLGDGSSWYFTQEDLEMKEFTRDKEAMILFGKLSDSGIKASRGVYDYALTYGVNNGYASVVGVTENDIQEHIKDLLIENVSNDIYVLCGATFLMNAQRALKDYAMNGAISYGGFGNNTVGLDFHSYKFMGKTIHFMFYELFEDQSIVPTPTNGINSTSRVNFSDFSLWLDFGNEGNGIPLINLKHKAHKNMNRKFVHAYEVGMVNPNGTQGGMVANGNDKFTLHYLTHFGVECRLPNRLGILRATS